MERGQVVGMFMWGPRWVSFLVTSMPPVTIDWNVIDRPSIAIERLASRRSVVYGTRGIVACSQPLAAQAGLEILNKGGNASMYSSTIAFITFSYTVPILSSSLQWTRLWRLVLL